VHIGRTGPGFGRSPRMRSVGRFRRRTTRADLINVALEELARAGRDGRDDPHRGEQRVLRHGLGKSHRVSELVAVFMSVRSSRARRSRSTKGSVCRLIQVSSRRPSLPRMLHVHPPTVHRCPLIVE
jgi:hypothetical protein